MMWATWARGASPGGPSGSLSVLFFHRVLAEADPVLPSEPTAARFERVLDWLGSQFKLLPLDQAVQRLQAGTLPPAAAAITFDDGYRDNFEIAAPILHRRGVPATFFVASGFLDGGVMWNDAVIECIRSTRHDTLDLSQLGLPALALHDWAGRQHAAETVLKAIKYLPFDERARLVAGIARACAVEPPRGLMMSTEQVRGLVAMGFGVGAHTETHPILARLPDAEASVEIRRGRDRLEAIANQRVGLFAYPNGRWRDDFDERHVGMVENAGFDAAFTTEPGVGRFASNRFALPRFTAWDRKPWRFKLRMMANMRRTQTLGTTIGGP